MSLPINNSFRQMDCAVMFFFSYCTFHPHGSSDFKYNDPLIYHNCLYFVSNVTSLFSSLIMHRSTTIHLSNALLIHSLPIHSLQKIFTSEIQVRHQDTSFDLNIFTLEAHSLCIRCKKHVYQYDLQ